MALSPSKWMKMRKTGLTLFGVTFLFVLCTAYAGSEMYHANLSRMNDAIHKISGFGWLSLPQIHLPLVADTFRLGLDLKSGTHLVYQADVSNISESERASAVEGVRDVIERRVNAFGVSEPVVQTVKVGSEYRVNVELAGVLDPLKAKQLIGETPFLEFKEGNAEASVNKELTPEQKRQLDTENAIIKKKADDALKRALSGEDFSVLAKLSDDVSTKDSGGELGWVNRWQRSVTRRP